MCVRLFVGLLSLFMYLCVPTVSYAAVATSSNTEYDADSNIDADDLYPDEIELIDDIHTDEGDVNGVLYEILDGVNAIRGALVASPSDADLLDDLEENEESVLLADDISVYASLTLPSHDCVWYRGQFNGTDYILVFPIEYYNKLNVSENGILYNLSSGNITGRLFTSESFDSSDYNYRTFTLLPVLGNSANNLYRYGSLSYMTYYYVQGNYNNLTSSTTYGNFVVEDAELKRSLDIDYRTYYVAVACLFMLGVITLCSWKNSRL